MADATGVLVLGELEDGSLTSTTKELLAAGRSLADGLEQRLAIGLVGADPGLTASDAVAHGADLVCLVSDPLLSDYQPELHLAALARICSETSPSVLLTGRTDNGREIAPRLAARLGVGLAHDCLEVAIDAESKRMVAHRPVYGGNARVAVVCTGVPQMASVRPKAYAPLEADPSRQGETVSLDMDLDPSIARVKLVERKEEEARGIQLETAQLIVAGGRGLGGPEPFEHLDAVAKLLGAGIGASRAAVDAGWVPASWQIGLTGKTITPDLYITVGISGASQHMAGCSGAKAIVAINRDPEANIFKEARYGVVGDWEKVLPAFTEALRELVA